MNNQEKFLLAYGPKEIKPGVFNVTACFHPTHSRTFPGVYGMTVFLAEVKANLSSFKRHAKTISDLPAGGMIVFSSDTGSSAIDGQVDDVIQSNLQEYQRSFAEGYLDSTVDNYIQENELKEGIGYTFGQGFSGKWVDGGNVFDESSFTVDIAGVDSKTLENIASEIAHNFSQKAVLVRDFNSGSAHLVDGGVPEKTEPAENNVDASRHNDFYALGDNLFPRK